MPTDRNSQGEGARNLLGACAGAVAGETVLILREDPDHGYYGPGLAERIAEEAVALGLAPRVVDVPFDPEADSLPADLAAAVAEADHTVFLARLGDQLRFKAMPPGSRSVVSYVLDLEALGSAFGAVPHAAMVALKQAVDTAFAGARDIRVTCPLGTDLGGCPPAADTAAAPGAGDVTIKRFPMSVFAPIDAAGFAGVVAIAHMLCGTGSRYYQPYGLRLEGVLKAHIAGGRLLGFEGAADDVDRARAHGAQVAARFGIDGSAVHSWHAGIHPACAYAGSAHENYERWSGSAFGNPRLLHLHTCGAYAPGEICWNVVDPTVELDGVALWEAGTLRVDRLPGGLDLLSAHPALAAAFAAPARDIGLGGGP